MRLVQSYTTQIVSIFIISNIICVCNAFVAKHNNLTLNTVKNSVGTSKHANGKFPLIYSVPNEATPQKSENGNFSNAKVTYNSKIDSNGPANDSNKSYVTDSTSNGEVHDKNGISSSESSQISENDFCNEFSKSFMQYALSIILGRALPDVRDGLKVVHRRILWAMNELNLTSNSPFRKCAKVVGDVLGKFHPHSDKSVYDALCRLSQPFAQRMPLIEGHGNFGTIDDPPAAMRYTECRLSAECGKVYMSNVENDTVDFVPNFDSSEIEPTVLPSKLPMLLINGTSGIAVGLAANIPCHNPYEILNASIHMARNRGNSTLDDILGIVKGPDFPSGGVLNASNELLKQVYETGKGSIEVSALLCFEERFKDSTENVLAVKKPHDLHFSPGSRISIIIKQLPFGVHVTDVTMALLKGIQDGVLSGISDIRDETDHTGIRLCLDLKKHVSTVQEIEHIIEGIYKNSKLRTFYKCNFIALVQRNQSLVPVRLSLLSTLKYWLQFRVDTIKRKVNFFLKKAQDRQTVIEGMIKVVNNAENVVKMIRNSISATEIRKSLATKEFGSLNKIQTDAVMKLTLFQLTKLHSDALLKENDKLVYDLSKYKKILSNPDTIYDMIVEELEDLRACNKQLFAPGNRKTLIKGDEDVLDNIIYQSYEERSILSLNLRTGIMQKSKIPTTIAKPRSLPAPLIISESVLDKIDNTTSEVTKTKSDTLFECLKIGQHILLISNTGIMYTMPDSSINFSSKGICLTKLIPGINAQMISSISSIAPYTADPESKLYIVNQSGWLRMVHNKQLLEVQMKNGIRKLRLFRGKAEDDQLILLQAKPSDNNYLLLGTMDGFIIKLSLEALENSKKMTKLINLRTNDKVSCACIVKQNSQVLLLSTTSHLKTMNVDDIRLQSRRGRGINSHVTGNGNLILLQPIVNPHSDLLIVTRSCLFRKKFPLKEKLAKHKPMRIRAFNDEDGLIRFATLV